MKKLGIILRHAPYGNSFCHEALAAILATGIYGQAPTLFFMGDGVFQLTQNQKPNDLRQKNLAKQFSALDLYDINKLFVCETALNKRGLHSEHLALGATIVSAATLSDLVHEQDILLSF